MVYHRQPCINLNCGDDSPEDPLSTPVPPASPTPMALRPYGVGFPIASGTPAPLTASQLEANLARRGNVDAIRNLDTDYNKVRWCIEIYDGSDALLNEFTDLTFPSQASFISFLNANVPADSGSFNCNVVARPYDVIAGNGLVWKIYGRNLIMANIRFPYWSGPPYVQAQTAWAQRNDMLLKLWEVCHGTSFGKTANELNENDLRCFWFSTNRKRYYNIARTGSASVSIGPTTASGRHYRQDSASTIAVPANTFWGENGQRNYAAVDQNLNLVAIEDDTSAISYATVALVEGYSMVLGIPLTSGDTRRALLIKPMGIDEFYSNAFDPASFRLEAVGSFEHDTHRRLRTLSDPASVQNGRDLAGPFNMSQWYGAAYWNLTKESNGGSVRPGRVRFQIRDLTDNVVSQLSAAQIEWWVRKSGLPLAALAHNQVQ